MTQRPGPTWDELVSYPTLKPLQWPLLSPKELVQSKDFEDVLKEMWPSSNHRSAIRELLKQFSQADTGQQQGLPQFLPQFLTQSDIKGRQIHADEQREFTIPILNRCTEIFVFALILGLNHILPNSNRSTHPPLFVLSSQMFGSGKTKAPTRYCEAYNDPDFRPFRKKLEQIFGTSMTQRLFNVQYVLMDLRYISRLPEAATEQEFYSLLKQYLAVCIYRATKREDKLSQLTSRPLGTLTSLDIVSALENPDKPIFLHVDEIDTCFNSGGVTGIIGKSENTIINNVERIYWIWNFFQPLIENERLVYISGKTPLIYNINQQKYKIFGITSPRSTVCLVIYDNLGVRYVRSLLRDCIAKKKIHLKKGLENTDLKKIAIQIYNFTGGVPRLVYYVLLFLATSHSFMNRRLDTEYLESNTFATNFLADYADRQNYELEPFGYFKMLDTEIGVEFSTLYTRLMQVAALEIPINLNDTVHVKSLDRDCTYLELAHLFGLFVKTSKYCTLQDDEEKDEDADKDEDSDEDYNDKFDKLFKPNCVLSHDIISLASGRLGSNAAFKSYMNKHSTSESSSSTENNSRSHQLLVFPQVVVDRWAYCTQNKFNWFISRWYKTLPSDGSVLEKMTSICFTQRLHFNGLSNSSIVSDLFKYLSGSFFGSVPIPSELPTAEFGRLPTFSTQKKVYPDKEELQNYFHKQYSLTVVPSTLKTFESMLEFIVPFTYYTTGTLRVSNSASTDHVMTSDPIDQTKPVSKSNPPNDVLCIQIKENINSVGKAKFGLYLLIKEFKKALIFKPAASRLTFLVIQLGDLSQELREYKEKKDIKDTDGTILAYFYGPNSHFEYSKKTSPRQKGKAKQHNEKEEANKLSKKGEGKKQSKKGQVKQGKKGGGKKQGKKSESKSNIKGQTAQGNKKRKSSDLVDSATVTNIAAKKAKVEMTLGADTDIVILTQDGTKRFLGVNYSLIYSKRLQDFLLEKLPEHAPFWEKK